MAYRKDILNQIENDLKDNLTRANGYTFQPITVKRGVHSVNSFPDLPVVCFSVTGDKPYEDNEHGIELRVLTIGLYVYARTNDEGKSETLNDMVQDIQDFVQNTSHFTYVDETLVGDIEMSEGGSGNENDKTAALIWLNVFYDADNS